MTMVSQCAYSGVGPRRRSDGLWLNWPLALGLTASLAVWATILDYLARRLAQP